MIVMRYFTAAMLHTQTRTHTHARTQTDTHTHTCAHYRHGVVTNAKSASSVDFYRLMLCCWLPVVLRLVSSAAPSTHSHIITLGH